MIRVVGLRVCERAESDGCDVCCADEGDLSLVAGCVYLALVLDEEFLRLFGKVLCLTMVSSRTL